MLFICDMYVYYKRDIVSTSTNVYYYLFFISILTGDVLNTGK